MNSELGDREKGTDLGARDGSEDNGAEDKVDEPEVDEDAVADVDEDDGSAEMTAEINVEELVAKLDATPKDDVERRKKIRKRLDELRDEREAMKDLDSTYNFNLDDEL